ncbi:insulin-like growth factor-binding protein 7 [Myotis lucifugus]|uniref:insulin-like growth factor-binding protein 7 n=1 Tax=Myotis lucifugus TaxID=59463 RepID=UPI000CCC03DB|nr:insulin-like growth factor-binding protein 7 [Myotis lucifugus]
MEKCLALAGLLEEGEKDSHPGPVGNLERIPGAKRLLLEELPSVFCCEGPSIVTPPKNIWNVTGAKVYLSCEVIGIPTPVLIWNKVKKDDNRFHRTELLPGDRDNLAIQTRGGPEKHEVTGWVLLSPLSKEDAGEYECHASNSQGQASASAKITVVDSIHEIPVTKGESAKL